jgi:hypothetical protein
MTVAQALQVAEKRVYFIIPPMTNCSLSGHASTELHVNFGGRVFLSFLSDDKKVGHLSHMLFSVSAFLGGVDSRKPNRLK